MHGKERQRAANNITHAARRRARGPGIFRWRRRLGRFDNAAQVAEELHVRHGLPATEAWDLVIDVQQDHDGVETDPRLVWRECRKRIGR